LASALFKAGDLIEVSVKTLDDKKPAQLLLEQPPAVEGSLIAIDNRTGQIRAMVGGFSFLRSKFNRATQARRQVGSLFKPIVYTAAIDRGYTPISTFIDEPVSFEAGPNQPRYEPLNYDRKYERPCDVAARARGLAQYSGREGDVRSGAGRSGRLRQALRLAR
jgi:penicillin-binding protein 1A